LNKRSFCSTVKLQVIKDRETADLQTKAAKLGIDTSGLTNAQIIKAINNKKSITYAMFHLPIAFLT
jgi:hypothetical protein